MIWNQFKFESILYVKFELIGEFFNHVLIEFMSSSPVLVYLI